MKITVGLLKERHQYWLEKIHNVGIWDKNKFLSIDFVIRYNNKSYVGLFHRKVLKNNSRFKYATNGINGIYYDRIILYNNKSDYKLEDIDDTLVHEMIHQYIIQNNIKDTSIHGRLFCQIMDKINCEFFGELNITLKDAPIKKEIKEGLNTYKMLILLKDNEFFACKIRPSKVYELDSYVRKNIKNWNINSFYWCETKNTYFDNFTECTRTIHGIKKSINELDAFCKKYNIVKKSIIEDL